MSSIEPKTVTTTTGERITIRTARAEDAAAMLAYIRPLAAATEFFVLQPDEFPDEEQERKWIQEHLDRPGQILLLAEAGGRIIGNVSFEGGLYRRVAHRGTLGLAVVEEWRGRGVGTALMQTLLDWAAASPAIEKVTLEVFATNDRAIRLYKKLGFVDEGLRPRDIKLGLGRYVDTIAMHRFVK